MWYLEKQEQTVTKILVNEKEKRTPPLVFDSPLFWLSHPFWNFNHLPINSGLETIRKRAVFPRDCPKTQTIVRYSNQARKKAYLAYLAYLAYFQLKCSYVSFKRNSLNVRGVQVTESSIKEKISINYICYTSLFKGICC